MSLSIAMKNLTIKWPASTHCYSVIDQEVGRSGVACIAEPGDTEPDDGGEASSR